MDTGDSRTMGNAPPPVSLLAAFERHRRLFNQRAKHEWLENLVEQPFIEEPAHSPRRIGRRHFAEIMDAVVAAGSRAMIAEPLAAICNGNELAVHLLVRDGAPQTGADLHVMEIF